MGEKTSSHGERGEFIWKLMMLMVLKTLRDFQSLKIIWVQQV